MEKLNIGEITMTWLNGGVTHLDGGAMFGVVPRTLWTRKYPVNDKNQIELRTDPILIQAHGKNILIEAGIGNGKLTDKQRRNYGVLEESSVESSLLKMRLSLDDIDFVLMTHMHFDHACGLTYYSEEGSLQSTFKNAVIYTSEIEWNEMRNPNIRSKNTYWLENWEAIENQVKTFSHELEVIEGVRMFHTGGHSDGHSVVTIENGNEKLLHLADLMPTHAHQNPLWVMAYDDYPMTSIKEKEQWFKKGLSENCWFSFYHDAKYRALKWDSEGNISAKLERNSKE